MKIFLDPGHNHAGGDTGATGNGLKEQDVTFTIAEALRPLLEGYGHTVTMSRNALTDSVGATEAISIRERALMANEWGADLFISIHCNAYNGLARGTETLVYGIESPALVMAQRVQNAIVSAMGTVNRGVKARPDVGVLWRTNMPAFLVETAFIDNPSDATLLRNHAEGFAKAICHGVVGEVRAASQEQTETETVVSQLAEKGIITDRPLWLRKLAADQNAFWLAKKCLDYIRGMKS